MIWAAPGIERLPDITGNLGHTDFVRVYIAEGLAPPDDQIVELHELSHIWLRHGERHRAFKPENFQLWNIACDLEIAKHCYDDATAAHMRLPTSVTSTGIKREDAATYPGCSYAEEFYPELQKQEANVAELLKKLWQDMEPSRETRKIETIDIPALIEGLRTRVKDLATSRTSSAVQNHTIKKVGTLPRPTLYSEIDRYLGRYRIASVPSYRRPAKYNPGSGLLRKGKLLSARRPKVNIYVDRSGSFTSEKTAEAEKGLSKILSRYGASITNDALEFSDDVGKNIVRGMGTNYLAVYESVIRDRPKIAIIITDNDRCPALGRCPETLILIVPVGCSHTDIAKKWLGSVEV